VRLERVFGMSTTRRKGVSREGEVEVPSSEWRVRCPASEVRSWEIGPGDVGRVFKHKVMRDGDKV
jgi:hypothetical protein